MTLQSAFKNATETLANPEFHYNDALLIGLRKPISNSYVIGEIKYVNEPNAYLRKEVMSDKNIIARIQRTALGTLQIQSRYENVRETWEKF